MKHTLEICAGSLKSALNAQLGGAHRIELCGNLSEGGTTPSPGIIKEAVRRLSIPVFVLIRPRAGDFIYSEEEFEAMKTDIRFCAEHGAEGVVLGVLDSDGKVDMERMAQLVALARPMHVTFHRAFDMVADPFMALEDIIGMGIDRILTSGLAGSALKGSGLIKQLNNRTNSRIIIMPGGGITEYNISQVAALTGAHEFHASLRSIVDSRMNFRNPNTSMGAGSRNEFSWMETDIEKVKQVVSILESHKG